VIRPFTEKHLDAVHSIIKMTNHDAVSHLLRIYPQLWECDQPNDSIVFGGYQITQVMDGIAMRYEVFVELVQYDSECGYDYDVIELGKTVRFIDAVILVINAEMQGWINNNSYSLDLDLGV
jgi:hypothetical protein